LLSINANTDATEFRKEIRWNSMHYKLSK